MPPSSSSHARRRADVAAGLRLIRRSGDAAADTVLRDRRLVAEFCRMLAPDAIDEVPSAPVDPAAGLTPRLRQTLQRLLAGDSEKEVARHLGVSPNTVHVYVRALYRHFDVNSRGELLARFVRTVHLNR